MVSCGGSENSPRQFESAEVLIQSVPKVTPRKITEFSQVDTLFFGFLGLDTITSDDGSFVLVDPKSGFIAHIDSSGNLLKKIAQQGRGPGEFLDVFYLQPRPGGGFSVYDQGNKKAIFFGPDLEFDKEVPLRSNTHIGGITRIYDLGEENNLLIQGSTSVIFNPDSKRKINLVIIKERGDSLFWETELNARPYVAIGVGAAALPFANRQLIRYRPQTQTFFPTGQDQTHWLK